LKAENDVDRGDVTSGGRLFHDFAAATGKARSPMVQSRVRVINGVPDTPRHFFHFTSAFVARFFGQSTASVSASWNLSTLSKFCDWALIHYVIHGLTPHSNSFGV